MQLDFSFGTQYANVKFITGKDECNQAAAELASTKRCTSTAISTNQRLRCCYLRQVAREDGHGHEMYGCFAGWGRIHQNTNTWVVILAQGVRADLHGVLAAAGTIAAAVAAAVAHAVAATLGLAVAAAAVAAAAVAQAVATAVAAAAVAQAVAAADAAAVAGMPMCDNMGQFAAREPIEQCALKDNTDYAHPVQEGDDDGTVTPCHGGKWEGAQAPYGCR